VSESSAEDAVDMNVTVDMMKLQDSFPGFTRKYRLIKRIGEGNVIPRQRSLPFS
jgi:cell division control protein 7